MQSSKVKTTKFTQSHGNAIILTIVRPRITSTVVVPFDLIGSLMMMSLGQSLSLAMEGGSEKRREEENRNGGSKN